MLSGWHLDTFISEEHTVYFLFVSLTQGKGIAEKCYLQPLDQVAGSKVVRDEGPGREPLDRTRGGRVGHRLVKDTARRDGSR